MAQAKKPGFLKKIEKVINLIPDLETQLFAYRRNNRVSNPLLFLDRENEGRILMSIVKRMENDAKQIAKIEYLMRDDTLSTFSILLFIYWRYTKQVYRLSEDIISDVSNTFVDDIPAQVLSELPAWSIYIEADNLHKHLPTSYPINGFFFYPLINDKGDIVTIFIVDDLKQGDGISGLKEKVVDVVDNTVKIKASREGLIESRRMQFVDGEWVEAIDEQLKDFRDREFNLLNAQISMALYICSQTTDVREKGNMKRPEKHKGSYHHEQNIPEKEIREWDVGVRMGQAIRKYRSSESGNGEITAAKGKRPHIRRGHWHTYWTGSRKPEMVHERKPKLKWLPPVPVNSEDVEKLPVVITPVEK